MEKVVNLIIGGHICRSILHLPETMKCYDQPVNILNPGLKYRVGPHRLNVKLARHLVKNGYPVLRFDARGIGDNEGELPLYTVANLWCKIEQGYFVNDILIANRFLLDECQVTRLCLVGLCGGAISALLAAAQDERVDRLILIDVPVLYSMNIKNDRDLITSKDYADLLLTFYWKKYLKPKAWWRFFSFQSDYRAILKILFFKIKRRRENNNAWKISSSSYPGNFNFLFLNAFKKCMAEKKLILFILSENSHTTGEFIETFQKSELFPGNPYKKFYQIAVIKDSNHTYTLTEWQEDLFSNITNWLSWTNGVLQPTNLHEKVQALQHIIS